MKNSIVNVLVGVILIIFICSVVCFETVDGDRHDAHEQSYRYCHGYCTTSARYMDGFTCHRPALYCCGHLNYRYCCNDSYSDVNNRYPDPRGYCSASQQWWVYHWQIAIGTLSFVVIVMVCCACCCQCCNRSTRFPRRVSDDVDVSTVSVAADEVSMHSPTTFDPNSPFAFAPPAYDSLPKDPPKYMEIFGEGVSADNPGYVPDGEVASNSNGPSLAAVHRALPHRKRLNTPTQGHSNEGDVTIPLSPDARNDETTTTEPSTPPPPYSAEDESITMTRNVQVAEADQACANDNVNGTTDNAAADQHTSQTTARPAAAPAATRGSSTDAIVDMTPAHSSVA